jgi:hypothetical protein
MCAGKRNGVQRAKKRHFVLLYLYVLVAILTHSRTSTGTGMYIAYLLRTGMYHTVEYDI